MTNHGDVLATSVDVPDVLRRLEALAEHWQHTAERFRVQWQESEWYLGETRATLVETQEQLASVRETYGWLESAYGGVMPQLEESARQRDEANRDLRQIRDAQDALLREHLEMTAELAGARHDLEAMRRFAEAVQDKLDTECARREALARELEAVRRRAERRNTTRTHHPDLIAEVHAADGQLLFQGCPSNVSLTGLALAVDEPIADSHDFVKVTIYGPAVGRRIEAIGRLVWRQSAEAIFHGGCELIEMSTEGRKTLEEALATAA
jgi:PilZ domain